MITVRFACGHLYEVDGNDAPVCPRCGEHRVSRVTAPAPRFNGWCSGPSAESQPVAGVPIAIPKEL